LGGNKNTIKNKNTKTPLDAIKGVGLQISAERTKYIFVVRHQNAGRTHNIKAAVISFETVAKFKCECMGVTINTRVTFMKKLT